LLQVIQNYKSGELAVDDVPEPALQEGGILVRTMFSLISAGTERTTVETAQKNLLGKARSRPDLVKKVFQVARRDGVGQTFQMVKNKLDTPLPLGYSSAGIVIGVGAGVSEFAVGDRVACAGQGYASHAEVVFIPKNLAVKLPDNVSLEDAAYATLGSIAMQGVRQAEIMVGENVAVVGLGLLGLITVQILRACGCRVIGFDIHSSTCATAKELGADHAFLIDEEYDPVLERLTDGYGVDSAIITAAAKDNGPVVLAGEIVRNKGKIVIVGAVPADIPRSPFYEKEIDVKFSRSYGPGRYDVSYEERGMDYPHGYVRWTENRNMMSFLQLVSQAKINLKSITTHRFKIEEAKNAYDLITYKVKNESFIGILLAYDHRAADTEKAVFIKGSPSKKHSNKIISAGFIGAGSFAQNFILPILKQNKKNVRLTGVSTSKGITSKNVAKKFKFFFSTTDNNQILKDEEIQAVFIATRHNLHARYVIESLKAGKAVFVEKPLAMNLAELNQIALAHRENPHSVMVGFNRRFAPTIVEMKTFFGKRVQPAVINYRVNAGFVPKEHWTQDSVEGGGRIIGEVCHFVDLLMHLTGSLPIKVYADLVSAARDEMISKDNVSITFKYRDGSIGNIIYTAAGDKTFPKERIEMFCEGSVAVIDDFKTVTFSRHGKTKTFGGSTQDKGYRGTLQAFIQSLQTGSDCPIPLQESVHSTMATLKILESLSVGYPVNIILDDRQEFLNNLSRIHTESIRQPT